MADSYTQTYDLIREEIYWKTVGNQTPLIQLDICRTHLSLALDEALTHFLVREVYRINAN